MVPSAPPRGRIRFAVRRARSSEVAVLAENRRHMWEDLGRGGPMAPDLMERADRRFRRWARPRLKNGTLIGFIAEAPDGRVLGSGAVWLQPVHPRPWWTQEVSPYLMAMYTRKDARGHGVASAIVRAALEWTRAQGYPRLVLHASEMGRSVYARLGFERSWEMRYLFQDPPGGPGRRRAAPRLGRARGGRPKGAPRTRGKGRRVPRPAPKRGVAEFR